MKALTATVRLQLHAKFTFSEAAMLVPYFSELGISHLYLSPILMARSGSVHGYDVVDPTQINPELGGDAGLKHLVDQLQKHQMGLILDIVPNHMAVGGHENPWWQNVLEWGPHSPYAHYFDINWLSQDPWLNGRLLVPVLGEDYGVVLQLGTLQLQLDAVQGRIFVCYFDHHCPLNPPSYGELLRQTNSPALQKLAIDFIKSNLPTSKKNQQLHSELAAVLMDTCCRQDLENILQYYSTTPQQLHLLLERQFYRLTNWRTAADCINWRRFFDINGLGGLRTECPDVFHHIHTRIFELIKKGYIQGLRIDHIDGLADPRRYCRQLRQNIQRLAPAPETFSLHVEKILGPKEQLPLNWQVEGTTGYEFMEQVSLLLHDPQGEAPLKMLWSQHSGRPADFHREVQMARKQLLNTTLAGDLETVAQLFLQVARSDLMTRDITLGGLRRALCAVMEHFPVYRSYIHVGGRSVTDEHVIQQALEGARHNGLPRSDWPLLTRLDRWLGGQPLRDLPPGSARRLHKKAVARFQQLTSSVAAKAVEDTAGYRYGVLLSRNDVGFDPARFSASINEFHHACQWRLQYLPHNLLTTATHDHKRGEDTRARLTVLSERGKWFAQQAPKWLAESRILASRHGLREVPWAGDILMLLQTLLGSWPVDLNPNDVPAMAHYSERICQWQLKALREAKLQSSWQTPNTYYEALCKQYTQALLQAPEWQPLRDSIASAASELVPAGLLNSLSQTVLRMTVPGVPDLYQGAEGWDFSLVDPDNRHPVDFTTRQQYLAERLRQPYMPLTHWRDGHIKQWLIQKLLRLRQQYPELFTQGAYQPLEVRGKHSQKLIAFVRSHRQQQLLVIAPRLIYALLGHSKDQPLEVPSSHWSDTQILLPPSLHQHTWHALLVDQPSLPAASSLAVKACLPRLPLAVFMTN